MPENSSNQGIVLQGSYWHIKGIDVYKAGDNGLQVKGNNNLIEFCTFSAAATRTCRAYSARSPLTILGGVATREGLENRPSAHTQLTPLRACVCHAFSCCACALCVCSCAPVRIRNPLLAIRRLLARDLGTNLGW